MLLIFLIVIILIVSIYMELDLVFNFFFGLDTQIDLVWVLIAIFLQFFENCLSIVFIYFILHLLFFSRRKSSSTEPIIKSKLIMLLLIIGSGVVIPYWVVSLIIFSYRVICDLWSIGFVEEMVCGGVRDSSLSDRSWFSYFYSMFYNFFKEISEPLPAEDRFFFGMVHVVFDLALYAYFCFMSFHSLGEVDPMLATMVGLLYTYFICLFKLTQ